MVALACTMAMSFDKTIERTIAFDHWRVLLAVERITNTALPALATFTGTNPWH